MRLTDDPHTPGPPRDLVGYGPNPPKVSWPGGASLALSIVVNYEEGSELSHASGDGRHETVAEVPVVLPQDQRDLHVESVFEYGSRAGIWRLLRLLDEYEAKSTLFACAVALERNPEAGAWALRSGHELCSHGWRWEDHWPLRPDQERERIRWAIETFEQLYGQRPLGWFTRFGPGTNTRELLVEEGGFRYDSDSFNDDLPYLVDVSGTSHLVLPYSDVYNDTRFILPQGFGSPRDFVELCTEGIDELVREGRAGVPKMMSVGIHPRWIGQPGRIGALRAIIEHALDQGDVWIARRIDIADWWLAHHHEFTR